MQPRKPYQAPAIIFEARLHTQAGTGQSFPIDDPALEFDPARPGKPSNSRRNDGSVDPPRPPKPAAPSSSGGGSDGSIDPPRPPKPPSP